MCSPSRTQPKNNLDRARRKHKFSENSQHVSACQNEDLAVATLPAEGTPRLCSPNNPPIGRVGANQWRSEPADHQRLKCTLGRPPIAAEVSNRPYAQTNHCSVGSPLLLLIVIVSPTHSNHKQTSQPRTCVACHVVLPSPMGARSNGTSSTTHEPSIQLTNCDSSEPASTERE